jgi:hypothetical protein
MKLLQDSYAGIVSLKWYEAILCMVIVIVLYVSSTCLFALGGLPCGQAGLRSRAVRNNLHLPRHSSSARKVSWAPLSEHLRLATCDPLLPRGSTFVGI